MGILKKPGVMIAPSANSIATGSFDGPAIMCKEPVSSPPGHVKNENNSQEEQEIDADFAFVDIPLWEQDVTISAAAEMEEEIDEELSEPTQIKPKRAVQFLEPDENRVDTGRKKSKGAVNKMEGKEWRKRQQLRRRVERRREKRYDTFRSYSCHKRLSVLAKAVFACIPNYVEDVTYQEDPKAIVGLKRICILQLAFSILLWALSMSDMISRHNADGGGDFLAFFLREPTLFTLLPAIVGATYVLVRKWEFDPPSKMTRGCIFASYMVLFANYGLAFLMACLCPDPETDPFGYASGCIREEDLEKPISSFEDSVVYGAIALCWLALSCPAYVAISRVRACVLGRKHRLTRMEKVGSEARRQMRRFSV